jgi:hypothetical protein
VDHQTANAAISLLAADSIRIVSGPSHAAKLISDAMPNAR